MADQKSWKVHCISDLKLLSEYQAVTICQLQITLLPPATHLGAEQPRTDLIIFIYPQCVLTKLQRFLGNKTTPLYLKHIQGVQKKKFHLVCFWELAQLLNLYEFGLRKWQYCWTPCIILSLQNCGRSILKLPDLMLEWICEAKLKRC